MSIFAILLPAVLAIIVVLIVRTFYLQVRWTLLELMVLTTVCGSITGVVAKNMCSESREPFLFVPVGALSFVFMIPVFVGAWYGLHLAQLAKEERAWPRLGLILIGWLGVIGVIAIPATALMTFACLKRPQPPNADYYCVISWSLLLLLIPAVRVQRRCKAIRAEAFKRECEARRQKTSDRNRSE